MPMTVPKIEGHQMLERSKFELKGTNKKAVARHQKALTKWTVLGRGVRRGSTQVRFLPKSHLNEPRTVVLLQEYL